MSLEVLLIPIGIAAYAAWREGRSTALCERCKATAIKDQGLLVEALMVLGASQFRQQEGRIECLSPYGPLTFQRIGDVFLGRVDGRDESATVQMLNELQVAVGKVAQVQAVASMRLQARRMGMTLVEETTEDGSVKLVFEAGS